MAKFYALGTYTEESFQALLKTQTGQKGSGKGIVICYGRFIF